jgi:hypothetical protein
MYEIETKRPLRGQSQSRMDSVEDTAEEKIPEDAEDLKAFEERADEALISFEEMVKKLKKSGRKAK